MTAIHRRRHRRPHRSRQERARQRADRHRPRSPEGREGARHHHRSRLRPPGRSAAIDFAFVDVPGHERFVKNMLAGVGGIDLVVLVVAADESVMPQTREHFDICRLLRVPRGVVALTKSDLVDADMLELVRLEVARARARARSSRARRSSPVSARTGDGLDASARRARARRARGAGARADGAARLPIDRVFTMKGFGTVVTGTLGVGPHRGRRRTVVAAGRRPRQGARRAGAWRRGTTDAVAGQRAALNLGGVEVDDLARGQNARRAAARSGDTRSPTRSSSCCRPPAAQAWRARAVPSGDRRMLGRVRSSARRTRSRCRRSPRARGFVRLRLEAAGGRSRAATASSSAPTRRRHHRRRRHPRSSAAALPSAAGAPRAGQAPRVRSVH